jgi:hypothetical protein
VAELADARGSEPRAFGRGSASLPLVTVSRDGLEPGYPARSHKPYDVGSNPTPATVNPRGRVPGSGSYPQQVRCDSWTRNLPAEYANLVKRSGREPGDFVGSTPTSVTDGGKDRPGSVPIVVRRRFSAKMGHSPNLGRRRLRTPEIGVRFPSGPLTIGPMVQRDDTSSACWKSEFDSRWVH